ncbi:hypothetical protein LOD99_7460 [Oopsacas minuta]|uniref:Uncharacterized protein n=1 Tax=Oopsacas minuta TaxID=111878 RepID=A0AAV7JU25_9METZ|nr:hypothetical protein LOD99_7460 [Oopsacas minuta]
MTSEMVAEGKQYVQLQKKKIEKGISQASIGKVSIYREYKKNSILRDVRSSEVPPCKNDSGFTSDIVSHFRAYLPLRKAPKFLYSSLENTTDTNIIPKCSSTEFINEEVTECGNTIIQNDVSCAYSRDITQIQCNSSSIEVRTDFHNNRSDIFKDI